jgi:hypothetical protein
VPVVLAVIPHPREDPRALEELSSTHLDVVVSRDHPARHVLMAADLVVGMNSILLMEACYLGRAVLSLQPGLRGPDTLPTNRMGISRVVYDAAHIESSVSDLLLNEDSLSSLVEATAQLGVPGGAAERVAQVVYRLCQAGTANELAIS